jgi:hypothetical protein
MSVTVTQEYADRAEARQIEIRELCERLAIKVAIYLNDVASTGHTTPTPPRPKRLDLRPVNYAARLLDAFVASAGYNEAPAFMDSTGFPE